jgi:hypothetical protein
MFSAQWEEFVYKGEESRRKALSKVALNSRGCLLALSLRQPWAYLVSTRIKLIENRGWALPSAHTDAWIAIHVSKNFTAAEKKALVELLRFPRVLSELSEMRVCQCRRVIGRERFLDSVAFKALLRKQHSAIIGFFRVTEVLDDEACARSIDACFTSFPQKDSNFWRISDAIALPADEWITDVPGDRRLFALSSVDTATLRASLQRRLDSRPSLITAAYPIAPLHSTDDRRDITSDSAAAAAPRASETQDEDEPMHSASSTPSAAIRSAASEPTVVMRYCGMRMTERGTVELLHEPVVMDDEKIAEVDAEDSSVSSDDDDDDGFDSRGAIGVSRINIADKKREIAERLERESDRS